MNINWFRYFITLAETKNFYSAAESLGISPPTLSNAITELENYYKLKLINRTHKVKGLTPAGEKFLEKAKEVITSVNFMNNTMSEMLTGEPEGPFVLAGGTLGSESILPKIFVEILKLYPKISPSFYSMTTNELLPFLLNGKIDMAVLYHVPMLPDLNYVKGAKFSHVIVSSNPEKKEWHELSYINFGNLSGYTEKIWPEEKFPRKIVGEVDSLYSAVDICEVGIAAAYVPEMIVRDKLDEGRLHIVAEPPFEYNSNLYLLWSKHLIPRPAFSIVLDFLLKEIQK